MIMGPTSASAAASTRRKQESSSAPSVPSKAKSLLDWYSGAAEAISDRLACCASTSFQNQIELSDDEENNEGHQEWYADDSSIVDSSPSRDRTRQHQQDAARWQESLKRQSHERGETRRRVATNGPMPSQLLRSSCEACLAATPEAACASTHLTGEDLLPNQSRRRRPHDQEDGGKRESPHSHKPIDRSNRKGGGERRGTKGNGAKNKVFASSPSSAFDILPNAVPLRPVASFGTATTTSMTTCKSSNCMADTPRIGGSGAVESYPSSVPMMMAMADIPTDDEDIDHVDEDFAWDANSTTTTAIVSHCQNPFREKPQRQPENSTSPVAYRYLKRMKPEHYVHSDPEEEEHYRHISRFYHDDEEDIDSERAIYPKQNLRKAQDNSFKIFNYKEEELWLERETQQTLRRVQQSISHLPHMRPGQEYSC